MCCGPTDRAHLCVQAQCILFRRYPEVLAPFKYGGYPLLLGAVTLPEDSEESNAAHFLGSEKAPLLEVWYCVLSCCMLCDRLVSIFAMAFTVYSGLQLHHSKLQCNSSCLRLWSQPAMKLRDSFSWVMDSFQLCPPWLGKLGQGRPSPYAIALRYCPVLIREASCLDQRESSRKV